jgi:drug/metabolite transporter (DMT)-like permease
MHAHPVRPALFPPVAVPRVPVSILAALALAAAAILWGTSFVAAKVVVADLPPVAVAFLRFAIAAVVLVPIACRGGRRPALGAQPALLGLTGVTLFFLCQNAGLRQASAAHATLILGGGLPVLTALLAVCCLGERPSRRQLTGLAFSLTGVIAVAGTVGGGTASSLRGNGLLLLAAASGASYAILGRRAFAGPDPLGILAGSTLLGALFLAPPAVAEAAMIGAVWPSTDGILLLLYLGLGCSALAFALWAYGLRHLTAAQNAVFGALELPVGLAAAALLLGEALGPTQLAGAVLLLAGALCAIDRGSREPALRRE